MGPGPAEQVQAPRAVSGADACGRDELRWRSSRPACHSTEASLLWPPDVLQERPSPNSSLYSLRPSPQSVATFSWSVLQTPSSTAQCSAPVSDVLRLAHRAVAQTSVFGRLSCLLQMGHCPLLRSP